MKTLNEFLLEQGYRIYMCSLDQRYLSFVQEENYSVNVVCFFDEREQTSTQAQMQAFEEVHRGRLDYGRGKDIHFLRLVCTNALGVGKLVPGTDGQGLGEDGEESDRSWIGSVWYLIDDANPDPETGKPLGVRLFVPPDAVEDFYGLRRHLDAHISANGISIQLPEINLDTARQTRSDIDRAPAEQGPDGMPKIPKKEKPEIKDVSWMTMGLLLLNVVMYILSSMKVIDKQDLGLTIHVFEAGSQQFFRLLTYMFLHSSLWHLMGNMIMLYAAGSMIEEKMNRAVYMAMYIICGLAGGMLSVWAQLRTGEEYLSVGASGAIYGIMGALIAWTLMNRQWSSTRIYYRIAIALVLMFWVGSSEEGIDYMAHLGGFFAGLLFMGLYLLLTWKKRSVKKTDPSQ